MSDLIQASLDRFNEWFTDLRDRVEGAPPPIHRQMSKLSVEFEKLDGMICRATTPQWRGCVTDDRFDRGGHQRQNLEPQIQRRRPG